MSLGRIDYMEPVDEGDGKVGYQIVCEHHGMIYLKCEQWSLSGSNVVELSKEEFNRMCELSNAVWPLPTNMPIEPYRLQLMAYKDGGAVGGDLKENADEIRGRILEHIYCRIVRCAKHFVELRDERDYTLLAVFVVVSYFRGQFRNCPLLRIEGVTGSGKSTLLELLSLLCYRGTLMSDVTPTVIADMTDRYRVTVLLDETADMLKDPTYRVRMMSVLKSAFSSTGTQMRYNSDMDQTRNRVIETSLAFTIKEGNLPEDVINRSIEIVMVNSTRENLDSLNFLDLVEWEDPDDSPEAIRNDLYALKALTALAERGECRDIGAGGIFLTVDQRQVARELKTPAADGRYLWAIVNDLESVRIDHRNYDIAMVFYTVAKSMGGLAARDVISKIADNVSTVRDKLQNTTEAVLANAYLNIVYERCQPAVGRNDRISLSEVASVSKRITTHDIRAEYDRLRNLNGTYQCENAWRLRNDFVRIGFAVREGSGRLSYVVPEDPGFEKALYDLLYGMADYDNVKRFAGVREELNDRLYPRRQTRTEDGGSRWATAPTGASPTASTSSCITSARPSPDPPPTTGAGSWR